MRDETGHDHWEGSPVRDAARAQVVQAEGERVEEQPSHWLGRILGFEEGRGKGVGFKKCHYHDILMATGE